MSTLLEIQNLKKYFKTPRGMLHAVDDVSFAIDQGCTMGIVGESGCGKSTLGRTIAQLLQPTGGRILFSGQDGSRLKRSELKAYNRNIQMIFQDPFSSLNPRMTVFDAIAEPLRSHRDTQDLDKRVSGLMETVGLARRVAGAYPHELDGGRRQRIGIARALALSPEFIVCDEPVSALDVSIQAQVLNLLMDLQEEKKLTYLFITHDLSVVKHISDQIGVMYLGHLVEQCPTKALFRAQLHPYTKALLSAIPTINIDSRPERIVLKGEISSPINPAPGCRFAPRCPHACGQCRQSSPQLREILPGHHVACHLAEEINGIPGGAAE